MPRGMKAVVRPADAVLHMEPDTSQTPNLRPNLNIEVCDKVRRLTIAISGIIAVNYCIYIYIYIDIYMGGCQNYGPFWIPILIRHLIFRVPQKGTIILTTTHMYYYWYQYYYYSLDKWRTAA